VGALIAQAVISFGLWVHHMFATGIPHLSLAFFSAASLLVVVPTAIQVFAWLATLLKGRPRLTLPMLWVLGFFFIFVSGGLTGVMVAIVPFNLQVHDTHFVVAHLHHVLIGGFVFPVIGGIYHWLPQIAGRRSDAGLGKLAFWVTFIGFNLTFLVMHLTGLLGMTRRIYTYAPGLGMETLGVEMARGRPDQIILLPGPTMLPLFTALGLAFFFVSFLFSAYLISLAGLGAALVGVLAWLWRTGITYDPEPQPIGLGETAPAHVTSTSSPGWWGMLFTLLADTVFFGSLVFGYLFLWTSAPLWPPLETVETDWLAGGIAAGGLLLAALATTLADWRNRAGSYLAAELWLVAAALGSLAAVAAMAWIALVLTPDPTSHAYAATSAALAAYTGFHAGVGLIAALFLLARRRAGFISAKRLAEPRIVAAWQVYAAVTGLIALGLLFGVPVAMTGGGAG
jgi:hypothetical protein